MLSLDEPLDLKLPSGRTAGPVTFGKRACPSSICAPLSATRPRLQCTTFPSPPSSPDSQSSSQERPGSCFIPPAMDLSLSPSSRHASSLSPSPSSPSSPSPSSPLESPHSSSSPQPHLFSREAAHHRGVEGGASPPGYPFYFPIRSPPRGYSFPSSLFIGQNREKPVSPEPSLDGQLACRDHGRPHWEELQPMNTGKRRHPDPDRRVDPHAEVGSPQTTSSRPDTASSVEKPPEETLETLCVL